MKKAVLYARVSSKEQEKEGFSIDAQTKLLEEYSKKHNFSIVQTFTDAETAKKSGRTNFTKLIEYLKSNPNIKTVLVEKTDRLTRNFHDYVLIDDLVKELDLEIHLVKEGEILAKKAKSHTKLIHTIKVAIAQNFIDNLSEETSKGMEEKASQGHWPSKAPYGYLNSNKSIIIDPEKSKFVKRAYQLYGSGNHSLESLSQELYTEGFIFQASKHKAPKSALYRILMNKFYTGHFLFRGVNRIGHHEPIISFSLFKEVQKQFESLAKPDYSKQNIALAGLIKCGHCGCSVTGDIKKKNNKEYIYYRCTNQKGRCTRKYLREEKIFEQYEQIISSLRLSSSQHKWMVEALKDANSMKDQEIKERNKSLTLQIEKLNKRLSALYVDKLDGIVTEEFFRSQSEQWQSEIQQNQSMLVRLQEINKNQIELGLRILDFASNAEKLFREMEKFERPKLIKVLGSNSFLKDGIIELKLKEPFAALAKIAQNERTYP